MATTTGNPSPFPELEEALQSPDPSARSTSPGPASRGSVALEETLQAQLQDGRYADMRAEMGAQFVDDLQIPDPDDHRRSGVLAAEDSDPDPFPDLPPDEPQPEDAAVDGNLIFSFVDGVKGQQKFDVLNACLLAQLAANFKWDRREQPVQWTTYYGTVLENIGWVVPQFQFRHLQANQAKFTMDAVIIKLLTSLLAQNEMQAVQDTIDAIKALQDGDGRLTIWERNATQNHTGNFQIDSVGVSRSQVLQMKLGAFGLRTDTTVSKLLWMSFPKNSTTMDVTKTTFVLNEQVYAALRDPVLEKLQGRGKSYIRHLETADAP